MTASLSTPTAPPPARGVRAAARRRAQATSSDEAEPEVVAEAPTPPRTPARPAERSVGTLWKVVAVLGVLGTVGFGLAWRGAEGRAATEDGVTPAAVEMRDAARSFAVALTNFDAATIDADFDRIVEFATGDFATEADRFYDDEIRTQLREARATSRSEVRDLYVQRFDGASGSVFVVVDQTIANDLSPRPVTDVLRIDLGLRLVEGEWLVSSVDVLDAPVADQAGAAGLDDTTDGGG